MNKKTILICGYTSFASQGLDTLLQNNGHTVFLFNRGETGMNGNVIRGPILDMENNPHLNRKFDVIINYILLKDESVESNIEFTRAILRLCKKTEASHLIHLSSIAVYKTFKKKIDENTQVETRPEKKGLYAAQKLATENDTIEMAPEGLNISFLRAGFILGEGLPDPLVAAGFRTPVKAVLAAGNGASQMPLISRDLLNQSIAKVVDTPPTGIEKLLLVSRNSPSKNLYLKMCNEKLKAGKLTLSVSPLVWLAAAAGGEAVARLAGKSDKNLFSKISELCSDQRFDPSRTEQRLGFQLDMDWEQELTRSMPNPA